MQTDSLIQKIASVAYQFYSGNSTSRLSKLLNQVTPSHLGFSTESLAKGPQDDIEYFPIINTIHYSMCLFWLKQDATMPIHNHPNMTVYSKVIHGNLQLKLYDLLPLKSQIINNQLKAIPSLLALDTVVTPQNNPIKIDSYSPNLHSFKALDNGVLILDILGPPYEHTRQCNYFRHATHDEVLNYVLPDIPRLIKRKLPDYSLDNHDTLWLMQDDSISYDCTEREYKGQSCRDFNQVTMVLKQLADSHTDTTKGLGSELAQKLQFLADLSASGVDVLSVATSLAERTRG